MIWKLQFPITKRKTWDMEPRERLRRRKVDAFLEWIKLIPMSVPKDVDLIQDRYPDMDVDSYSEHISFSMGYNPEVREKVKKLMTRLSWDLISEKKEKGNDSLKYERWDENMRIQFNFSHWRDGSTCKRVKIGTETVEKPVYDVICNEAAEEIGM